MRTTPAQRWVLLFAIMALLGASLWVAGKDSMMLLQTVLSIFAEGG